MYLCIVNVLFLCLFNVTFFIAGVFLNSVVIYSIWNSPQLRKKLCYFMILVLSCFDLTVVAITHPVLLSSTISIFLGKYNNVQEIVRFYTGNVLNGLSLFALFALTMERFLALAYPFFHQTSVTRRRLIYFVVGLIIFTIAMATLLQLNIKILANLLTLIIFSVLLLLFIYLNYKMFLIGNSKRDKETDAMPTNQERKSLKLQSNRFSTCSLTVICFFVCFCPYFVYSALRLTSYKSTPFVKLAWYQIWAATFVSMNSTFNCLIFFWRNSILRREGMKTIKSCSRSRNLVCIAFKIE